MLIVLKYVFSSAIPWWGECGYWHGSLPCGQGSLLLPCCLLLRYNAIKGLHHCSSGLRLHAFATSPATQDCNTATQQGCNGSECDQRNPVQKCHITGRDRLCGRALTHRLRQQALFTSNSLCDRINAVQVAFPDQGLEQ